MIENRKRVSTGRIALALSTIGVTFAITATAFSSGSAVPGSGGVKADDIARGAVNSKKLANSSVGPAKIKPMIALGRSVTLGAGESTTVSQTCADRDPRSARVISGGFDVSSGEVRVLSSRPDSSTSWQIRAHNTSAAPQTLTTYAYCLF